MKSTEVQYCNKTLGVFFYLSAVVKNLFHAFVYIILEVHKHFFYIMVLYKKLVPSIFFRSIPSRSSLSFSRISILFLSSSQSEVWTVDGFERYRVDKKNWDLSSLSYTQPFKGKKVTRKKTRGP